jgi:predicted TIM-barrel enzyme
VDFITGAELAFIAVLADVNGVKKSVPMKTMTVEEINRRVMFFMFALLWIVVGRDTGKILDCRL